MEKIFILEDDHGLHEMLTLALRNQGFQVAGAARLTSAKNMILGDDYDIVISDIRLPDGSGLELLDEVWPKEKIKPEFIYMTAFGSVEEAVDSIRKGAFDYLLKPVGLKELRLKVEKALEKRKLCNENMRLKKEVHALRGLRPIFVSPKMEHIISLAHKIADSSATVLLTGESGTGKEIIARYIHSISFRHQASFVALNCAAIPKDLLESELFGYDKGAFTGALAPLKGKFEIANDGTILLDEIGEMDIDLQAKLLRVIEEKTVQRLGSVRTTPINVRIISTTNKNFESLIQANKFREDLFYRLNVIPIHLPPLRERKEDIPVLVRHFVATYGAGKNIEFPERTMTMLQHYHWPGNVRELRNLVERITLLSDAAVIEPEDLQQYLQMTNAAESKALPSNISVLTPRPTSLLNNVGHDRIAVESLPNDDIFTTMIDQGLSLYDVQREMIRAALKLSAGNRSKAALILRVPRYKLIYMEKKMTLLSEEP